MRRLNETIVNVWQPNFSYYSKHFTRIPSCISSTLCRALSLYQLQIVLEIDFMFDPSLFCFAPFLVQPILFHYHLVLLLLSFHCQLILGFFLLNLQWWNHVVFMIKTCPLTILHQGSRSCFRLRRVGANFAPRSVHLDGKTLFWRRLWVGHGSWN